MVMVEQNMAPSELGHTHGGMAVYGMAAQRQTRRSGKQ
jgi:hypothetical protein